MQQCRACAFQSDVEPFYYKNTPSCICRTCYHRAYGVRMRTTIYQRRKERVLRGQEARRMYKLPDAYKAARERLREMRRALQPDIVRAGFSELGT